MKLKIQVVFYLFIICACVCVTPANAQGLNMRSGGGSAGNRSTLPAGNQSGASTKNGDGSEKEEDPCIPLKDDRRCFTLDPLTGLVKPSVPDTSFLDMGNRQSMESKALAVNYTGNLYSPHQVEAYFDRRDRHDFLFMNAYNLFRTDPSQQLYFNTKIPFTVLSYAKSGSNIQENDHLKINFAGNFNQQAGIGSQLDYVYARGVYMSSSTKPLRWTSYGYYEGDQYKAYVNFNLSKLANHENGGITDRGFVLNPDNYNKNFTDPKNMPTRLAETWNETDTRQVHFQHSYDLGKWEERVDEADSSLYDEFIPIATIFHNIDFEHLHHNFIMGSGADISEDKFFPSKGFYDDVQTHDSTSYNNFSTYAGIRLNEGFNKYSQFGMSAFIGFEHQKYTMLPDSMDLKYIERNHFSNNIWVGGQLSRSLSSALTFDATLKTAISGDKAGDIDLSGVAQTVIPFGRRDSETNQRTDSVIVQFSGRMRNSHVSYMMEHYFGNYFRWSNNFSSEKQVRLEGKLSYPRTLSSVRVGIEHVSNFHYFDQKCMPREYNKQLDIFGLELRQGVRAGKWLKWENAVLIQTTTDKDHDVIALPNVSIESDISFRFRIARTLQIQAGAAVYYHTAYYAPNYQPATQQFHVQKDIKCGNFPLANAYVNCNLKRIKFFMAMHNVLSGTITNDAFLMPYYPVMPRRMEYGVILDLQN